MKKTRTSSIAAALVAALCCAGAAFGDMGDERQSRTYQAAMADYSAGRLDAAIDGFLKAIEANGNNASARFQLACLLQDHRKDWLGAMCSYREYLRLEGRSDKAPLARERLAQCERELAGELAAKYSLVSSVEQTKASEQIKRDLGETEKKAAAALKTLDETKKRLATLERENARLRRQLRSIGEDTGSSATPSGVVSASDLLDGDDDGNALPPVIPAAPQTPDEDGASPRRVPSGADVDVPDDGRTGPVGKMDAAAFEPDDQSTGLRQGLAEAKLLVEEDESGPELLQDEGEPQPGGARLSDFANRVGKGSGNKDRGDRPETYVVQDGDSLYKIARRFYGKESAWKQIRDANKATISTDGRVRTGQTIVLP